MTQKVFFEFNGVKLLAPILPEYEHILTAASLERVGEVTRILRPSWRQLMADRTRVQASIDSGLMPKFPTSSITAGTWQVAPIPGYLQNRKVEVVCPSGNRKMLLGAMNSSMLGAPICLGDLEDANGCQWGPGGVIDGLVNLYDASRGTLSFEHPAKGSQNLNKDHGYLMVRPRGLHFTEPRVLVDDEPVPAFIFDTVMHLSLNGRVLVQRGQGPDLYLAKLQSGPEAYWCNDVIGVTETLCHLPVNSAHVSVLFEHILGTLQIEEIIFALRTRFTAGNTGWLDYLASLSRTFRKYDGYIMPDPSQVTITTPCMAAYLDLVVSVCHKRGALAVGGTATQLAVEGDVAATEAAKAKVRANAEPYAKAGFDGGWVVYAPFTPIVAKVFDDAMPGNNQMDRTRDDVVVTTEQLLTPPHGTRSLEGLDENLAGAVTYEAAWLCGVGAVPITYRTSDGKPNRLMLDAAIGERNREDIWKWIKTGAVLIDGQPVDVSLVLERLLRFVQTKAQEVGNDGFEQGRFPDAVEQVIKQVISPQPPEYFPPELLKIVVAEENTEA